MKYRVYVEQSQGRIESVSLELISKARELADTLQQKVGAVLVGHEVAALAPALIAQGADKVYLSEHPALARFLPMPYKKAVCALVEREKPQIVLFGATPLGRELAPRVAYRSNAGLTADCTKLDIDDIERPNLSVIRARKLAALIRKIRIVYSMVSRAWEANKPFTKEFQAHRAEPEDLRIPRQFKAFARTRGKVNN